LSIAIFEFYPLPPIFLAAAQKSGGPGILFLFRNAP
jgi:hypothetical protein